MSSDIQMILVVGSVHVVGLLFAGALLWHFMRTADDDAPPHGDDGPGWGDGNLPVSPPKPTRPRGGGLPLPNAVPARVRLRGPERLSDALPSRSRRPGHPPVPGRPVTPVRTRR